MCLCSIIYWLSENGKEAHEIREGSPHPAAGFPDGSESRRERGREEASTSRLMGFSHDPGELQRAGAEMGNARLAWVKRRPSGNFQRLQQQKSACWVA